MHLMRMLSEERSMSSNISSVVKISEAPFCWRSVSKSAGIVISSSCIRVNRSSLHPTGPSNKRTAQARCRMTHARQAPRLMILYQHITHNKGDEIRAISQRIFGSTGVELLLA